MGFAKVLTITPDDHLRSLVTLALTQAARVVREVTSSTEAIVALQVDPADLVLIDLQLPTAAGLDALHALQKSQLASHPPCVLFSSGPVDGALKDLALAVGAVAVIETVNVPGQLSRRLDQALSAVHSPGTLTLTDEDFYRCRRDLLVQSLSKQASLLDRSEERFRDMVENTSDWIWEFDENYTFTYVSPKVRDLLGYEPDELLGTSAFAPMTGQEAERVGTTFEPIAKARKPFQGLINVNRHKDGHPVVIESSGVPIFSPDGTFKGYRGIDRDITERQQIEDVLRLTQVCVDQASEAIFRVDRDGRLIYANQKACQSLGYPPQELLRLTVFDIDPLIDRATWDQHWQKIRSEGGRAFESVHRRKDGQEFPVEIVIDHISFGDQEFHHAYIRDISEHKRSQEVTEQALEVANQALEEADEANERVRAILKSVPYGLIVTDPEQRIILMSRSAEAMLGKSRNKLSGRQLAEVIPHQSCVDLLASTLRSEETLPSVEIELYSHEKAGTRVVRVRTARVRTLQGRDIGGLVILADITRDREIDRMKTEFISAAAHELNTPLTSVIGFLEILINGFADQNLTLKQQERYLKLVFEKSLRLSDIVRDLLDIGRVESGHGIKLHLEPCQVDKVVRELVAQYEQETLQHQFHVDFHPPAGEIHADRGRLVQVLENLLSNAVKYSPQGGAIRINAQPHDGEFQIAVTDQGIGMSPAQVERIFEKFYRADALGPQVGGLGLGMSIVKGMVEAHGGRIWVESEPGSGTSVTFTLPIN